MSERWRRELTKLRQAPELPEDLWDRVRTGARLEAVRIPPRTRAFAIAVAIVIAIPALALAWTATHQARVQPSGLGVVAVPPLGTVAPANLADGRPVFVVHRFDGTVSVIDGFSTHDPFGISKLVAWCSSARTFDDVYHGSKWNESGIYIGGPAPSGLATYQSTIQPDGRLVVNARIPPAPRPSPGDRVHPFGPFCETSDNIEYPTISGNVSVSPADVVASSPDGWVAVRGSLIRGGPTGAQLCSLFSRADHGCAQEAPVEGIDVHELFGPHPDYVMSATFIARVQDGSLVDLTLVPGLPPHPPRSEMMW